MEMRKRSLRFLAWSSAAALLAAACSGGGGDSAATPATVTARAQTATATPRPSPTPTIPPATFADAREALRAGSYAEAALAFDSIANHTTDLQLQAEAWLGGGVARYLDGDLEGALNDLEAAYTAARGTPSERRVAYLYGLRLAEAGQDEAAVEVLTPVADAADDVLSPYILATYGKALWALGRQADADAAWDAALAHPRANDSLRVEVYRDRADAALETGALALATQWLRSATDIAATPALRYELASLAFQVGDYETFAGQLQAIVYEAPATSLADRAVDDLVAAGYTVDPGQMGYVKYRRRDFAAAREVLGQGVSEPGISASTLAFRTYYLAASYDDAGLKAESIPLYDSIAQIDPSSPYVHRAAYWAARAAEALGDAPSASARYVNVVRSTPAGEFTRESAFRAGLVLLQAGDAAGALDTWDSLGVVDDGRQLYWRARALEALDAPGAVSTFAESAARDPVSFYGQAAAVRAGLAPVPDAGYEGFNATSRIDWDAIAAWLQAGAVAPEPVDSAALQLVELGLFREAGTLLEQEAAGVADPIQKLAFVRAAHDAGLTSLTARWATQLAGSAADAPADLARLAFPVDYVELLDSAGERYGIDPLFLAALIRQESYWDASAVSVAGAIGLTQVIPTTGGSIAAALGHPDWDAGDLVRPAVSIEYGAYYIGEQLRRFHSPLVALAAYNGGPENAAYWSTTTASDDPADFVDAVTFSETRGYVVAVMENYARYRELYR